MPTPSSLRSTHTVVTMDVSPATYKEIHDKLKAAGYDHAISVNADGGMLDMTGIALVCETPEPRRNPIVGVALNSAQTANFHPDSVAVLFQSMPNVEDVEHIRRSLQLIAESPNPVDKG